MQPNNAELSSPNQALLHRVALILQLRGCWSKWKQQCRHSKHRLHVLKQWRDTERTYLSDLSVMRDQIKTPLQLQSLLQKQQSNKVLFPNLKSMIDLSEEMLEHLQSVVREWNPLTTMIGENIMRFHKFFIIYREYCNNYAKGQMILKRIKGQDGVRAINQTLQNSHHLDIQSYVIKPVQRPTKYQLLLRDYLKKLPKTHPDYPFVARAMQRYHEVNEENNQSMHQQQRNQTMIMLDKKLGGIISSRSGREYITQFECSLIPHSCLAYAFNDILIVAKKEGEKETVVRRIKLGPSSFVVYRPDNKYFEHLYFLCGESESVHLTFPSYAQGRHFEKTLHSLIDSLWTREDERRSRYSERESTRKSKGKMRVSKWYQEDSQRVEYKPKLIVKVLGSAKLNDVMYFVEFAITRPYTLRQLVLLPQRKILQMQTYLRQRFKQVRILDIDHAPEHFTFFESLKNSTKMIEHKCQVLQQLLNWVFRNEQFHSVWKGVSLVLGISLGLYTFAASRDFQCRCQMCLLGANKKGLQECVLALKDVLHRATALRWEVEHSDNYTYSMERRSYYSEQAGEVVVTQQLCSTYVFKLMQKLNELQDKSLVTSVKQRLMLLQAGMGRINYSLLQPQYYPLDAPKTLRLYLVTIRKQYIDITLTRDKYVREVMEEIGRKNGLGSVVDWGIFLLVDGQLYHIPNDQRLYSFAIKMGVELEETEEEGAGQEGEMSLKGLLRWGQQLFGSGRGQLFFKKYLYFEPELQLQWCKQHKQRYSFLVNTLYGRMRHQSLTFPHQQSIRLCSLYLAMTQFNRLTSSISTISLEQLRPILHSHFDYLMKNNEFKQEIYDRLEKYQKEIGGLKNMRNAIELIYMKVLYILRTHEEWELTLFPVRTYPAKEEAQLAVGHSHLQVMKEKGAKVRLVVPLEQLSYKITTFSLWVYYQHKVYRYDTPQAWNISQLIQTYQAYRRIFRQERADSASDYY